MRDRNGGPVEYAIKIRGITFDVENRKALQYEHFLEKVLAYGEEGQSAAIFKYNKIQPTQDSKIVTREMKKKYLPICQKGIIDNDLRVFPFGFE